jgi:hypothetical protein
MRYAVAPVSVRLSRLFAAAFVLLPLGARDDEPFDVARELAALGKHYSIEVEYEGPEFPVKTLHGPIRGEPASSAELEAYAPVLVKEFGRYPVDFVKRMGLKKIVLCRSLAFVDQRRAAVPHFGGNTMYLDAPRSMTTKQYARIVIHHECFHIVDWRDDGELYGDKVWSRLNTKVVKYGTGGKNAQSSSDMSLLTDKYPGFLTRYSMSGVEEDKAEVFAHLFVSGDVVTRRVADDPVLARKVERMRELLERFCKKVNAKFWRELERERVRAVTSGR